MSGIENWIQKLRKAEKTCIIQDGIIIILEKMKYSCFDDKSLRIIWSKIENLE